MQSDRRAARLKIKRKLFQACNAIQHYWLKAFFKTVGTARPRTETPGASSALRTLDRGSDHILFFLVSSCASQQDSGALKEGRLAKASIVASLSFYAAPSDPKGSSQVTANPL